MKRGKKLVENTAIIAIGNLSTKLITFILLPFYTTYLATNDYGTYDLFITIAIFLAPIITLLMEESMFRFLIDCKTEEEKKMIISITVSYIIKSFLVFLILYLIIILFIDIPYKIVYLLYVLSSIVVGLKNALTRGLGKIKLYSISNFVSSLLIIVLNIIFIAKYNMGVFGLLASFVISNLVVSFIVLWKLNLKKYVSLNNINKKKMKEMIKYSVPLVPNSLSWTIINLSDRIIVTFILGPSSNGIYSMAYKFPNLMDTFYGFFYTAWKESAARSLSDEDNAEFYNNVYNVLNKFLWAIVLLMITLLSIFFNVLIKKDFALSYSYIPLLIIAMYFSNISGYYGGIFAAYKETKIMGITTIIGALFNVLINLLLIKYIGIWAAVLSTLVSTFIVYVIRKIKISKYVLLHDHILFSIINSIMLLISLFSYFCGIVSIKIICLLIIVVYCLIINKEVVNIFIKKLRIIK